uniref:Uncharacterized protein n=1 Tax=Anguilla anguilla TaxID=7936 RepID=A0A0E9QTI1_ANGAN
MCLLNYLVQIHGVSFCEFVWPTTSQLSCCCFYMFSTSQLMALTVDRC